MGETDSRTNILHLAGRTSKGISGMVISLPPGKYNIWIKTLQSSLDIELLSYDEKTHEWEGDISDSRIKTLCIDEHEVYQRVITLGKCKEGSSTEQLECFKPVTNKTAGRLVFINPNMVADVMIKYKITEIE